MIILNVAKMQSLSGKALEAAENGAAMCEAQDSKQIDISLHAASYGLQGLF